MSAIQRALDGPPEDEYELRGDDGSVWVGCKVDCDVDRVPIWRAVGGGHVGLGDSKAEAVLNCLASRLTDRTDERCFYDPSLEGS